MTASKHHSTANSLPTPQEITGVCPQDICAEFEEKLILIVTADNILNVCLTDSMCSVIVTAKVTN